MSRPIPFLILWITASVWLCAGTESFSQRIEKTPEGFLIARPGYAYRFPRDHASHPGYKTEWWYYTGHLRSESGERFGFQWTFFRSALRPPKPGGDERSTSRWAVRDIYFAHFAISDFERRKFHFEERVSRGALGEAGADSERYRVWIKDWRSEAVERGTDAPHRLQAPGLRYGIDLIARPLKPPVIHGTDGTSRKGRARPQASHYISLTRMEVSGMLRVGHGPAAKNHRIQGTAWMDHEFGSSQLGKDQVGWDWFCIQLEDGREVMLYIMRKQDGTADRFSSGSWIDADGTTRHLKREDFRVEVLKKWKSPNSKGIYPILWIIHIPSRRATFRVEPVFSAQELTTGKSTKVNYWEGAVRVRGEAEGRPVQGQGYVEMTGYAGAFRRKI